MKTIYLQLFFNWFFTTDFWQLSFWKLILWQPIFLCLVFWQLYFLQLFFLTNNVFDNEFFDNCFLSNQISIIILSTCFYILFVWQPTFLTFNFFYTWFDWQQIFFYNWILLSTDFLQLIFLTSDLLTDFFTIDFYN